MPQWRKIEAFPAYSVSDAGEVRNDRTGRIIRATPNGRGVAVVGLRRNQRQYKRSVTVLVSNAFLLEKRPQPSFTTPINLDGDRTNNAVSNLRLRPAWFAIKYFRQFRQKSVAYPEPIMEINTREWFDSSWDAATKYGLLDEEVYIGMTENIWVWPTFQRFRAIG